MTHEVEGFSQKILDNLNHIANESNQFLELTADLENIGDSQVKQSAVIKSLSEKLSEITSAYKV